MLPMKTSPPTPPRRATRVMRSEVESVGVSTVTEGAVRAIVAVMALLLLFERLAFDACMMSK
jgi:hypothetical protein